ncbi:MAG TPA: GNAT family N-acetyltransferase [Rubrivivax sp.]|nr:GNAT family N-acetyltransferase [Rubrivivax sp.]
MSPSLPRSDTLIHVHDDPADVDAAAWNALLDTQSAPTPFMRHEYLSALHASGSAVGDTGWANQLLCLRRGDSLLGSCALYLKSHSYGEYVFDWAWADAYQRHGLRYYPKLLGAVPFTPVPGSRLLARDDASRRVLLAALRRLCDDAQLSSAHLLFIDDTDRHAAADAGWMLRRTVQFHWLNRGGAPYGDFDDFLAGLQRDKRKKIAQERRRVAEAGITFTVHEGEQIDTSLWDFFHHCYTLTYAAHHSTPYLTRDFFARMQHTMARHWVMFVAERGGRRVACSLVAVDAQRGHAWGRYWGSTEFVPCLHFEACYYQPLAWCIAQRYRRFEGGAQGEHKMARGLLPVLTHSAHWLRHPAFAEAVARHLAREGAGIGDYVDELRERNPYRDEPGG